MKDMSTVSLPHHHHETYDAARLKEELAAVQDFQTVADVFKQLGDTSRLRIFWLLCHCEECVVNISALMDMTTPAVSHHLRQLKAGGLIESRRDGKEVYYRAANTDRTLLLHDVTEKVMRIVCPKTIDDAR